MYSCLKSRKLLSGVLNNTASRVFQIPPWSTRDPIYAWNTSSMPLRGQRGMDSIDWQGFSFANLFTCIAHTLLFKIFAYIFQVPFKRAIFKEPPMNAALDWPQKLLLCFASLTGAKSQRAIVQMIQKHNGQLTPATFTKHSSQLLILQNPSKIKLQKRINQVSTPNTR